jgi:hypothetical protein
MVSVVQPWVNELTLMKQTVLLTALRGPGGVDKAHPTKLMVRWLRRQVHLVGTVGPQGTERGLLHRG